MCFILCWSDYTPSLQNVKQLEHVRRKLTRALKERHQEPEEALERSLLVSEKVNISLVEKFTSRTNKWNLQRDIV